MKMQALLRNAQLTDFLRNRYFMLGLCLQKGMPMLMIPVTVSVIGSVGYSQYVLLYTLVQTIGVVGSLCLPQSLLPFWYGSKSKESLLGSLLLLLVLCELAFYLPIGVALYLLWGQAHLDASRGGGIVLILIYSVFYNLNSLALNVLRIRLKQFAFFTTTIITSAALVALIVALRYVPGPKLVLYTLVCILVLAVQTGLYSRHTGLWPLKLLPREEFKVFAVDVLRYSWPLTIYTLVTLLAFTVDKWIVRSVFPQSVFSQYVLDFQFAFALSFLSVAIGMYNSQKLCELVHLDNKVELRSNLIGNYLLSIIGSAAMSIAAFTYARLGGIRLSHGFWILALGLTLGNCYNVNSNLLSAQRRSRRLAFITTSSSSLFLAILSFLFVWKSTSVLYMSYLVLNLVMLILSSGHAWRGLSKSKHLVECNGA